jgi:hypothetical protein
LRRREGDLVRDLVLVTLLGIVVSPVSWSHHYTIALLPFLYLWCKMPEKGSRALLALFLVIGTSIVGIVQFATTSHPVQLMLAAIIPGLMIAVTYQASGPRQESLNGRPALAAEAGEIVYSAT